MERRQGSGTQCVGGRGDTGEVAILDRVVSENLPEKVTFEQKEVQKRAMHMSRGGESASLEAGVGVYER